MSHSDRSRSPTLRRSGSALSHADLPGFPRWRGPMGSAVRASHAMSSPQTCRPWPDYLSQSKSGPYQTNQPQTHVPPFLETNQIELGTCGSTRGSTGFGRSRLLEGKGHPGNDLTRKWNASHKILRLNQVKVVKSESSCLL